jgi:hypothetical protein
MNYFHNITKIIRRKKPKTFTFLVFDCDAYLKNFFTALLPALSPPRQIPFLLPLVFSP